MESIRTFCICLTIGFVDADKGMESLCQTSFSNPLDMAATRKGWRVYARKQNFTPSIFGRCEKGWKVCAKQARSFHNIWQHLHPLIKYHAETAPSGFHSDDIPRFPESAPPHGDTDPATAERLGLDRRQMRDTIACSDGKGCLNLISLSSRRRGRHIAHLPAVRAGGRGCLFLISIF